MTTDVSARSACRVQPIGGSTAVIEVGGLRLVTDPTFDEPHASPPGRPRRTSAPALAARDLGHLDVALVSHDQHPDNLDAGGRALLQDIPLVLTTIEGAQRLGGSAHGLEPFESIEVKRRDGHALRVSALPAQHGPVGAEAQSGPVVGFLVAGDELPAVYVSGDNASVDVVRDIVARVGPVDIALLFVGAARVPSLFDGAPLTLTSADAVEAVRVLGARAVVPMHCEGWTHYSEDCQTVARSFAAAGLGDVLRVVAAGEAVSL